MRSIVINTDGSCLKNPGGPGGWAALIEVDAKRIDLLSGNASRTTNNRMELAGAIEGLKWVQERMTPEDSVTVISDSQYVVKGANTWSKKWKLKKWRGVKNLDLWLRLDALLMATGARFQWVRGHNGDPRNCECDKVAGKEALAAQSSNQYDLP